MTGIKVAVDRLLDNPDWVVGLMMKVGADLLEYIVCNSTAWMTMGRVVMLHFVIN